MVRDKVIHTLNVYAEPPSASPIPSNVTTYDHDNISTSTDLTDPNTKVFLIRVDLTTSAGTYVKEFVHGDDGRTVPSLKELLGVKDAAVETLDVTKVHLDWPPSLEAGGEGDADMEESAPTMSPGGSDLVSGGDVNKEELDDGDEEPSAKKQRV
jgi:hypothetical protein